MRSCIGLTQTPALIGRGTNVSPQIHGFYLRTKTRYNTYCTPHTTGFPRRVTTFQNTGQRSDTTVHSTGAAAQENTANMSHAILHDFCMNIPYGMSMVFLGILGMTLLGAGKFGLLVTSVGIVEIVLSSVSLKGWKKGKRNAPWTILGALCSSVLAYVSIELYKLAAYPLLSGSVGALSVCISLFLVYNVLSGGNPPPSQKNA